MESFWLHGDTLGHRASLTCDWFIFNLNKKFISSVFYIFKMSPFLTFLSTRSVLEVESWHIQPKSWQQVSPNLCMPLFVIVCSHSVFKAFYSYPDSKTCNVISCWPTSIPHPQNSLQMFPILKCNLMIGPNSIKEGRTPSNMVAVTRMEIS